MTPIIAFFFGWLVGAISIAATYQRRRPSEPVVIAPEGREVTMAEMFPDGLDSFVESTAVLLVNEDGSMRKIVDAFGEYTPKEWTDAHPNAPWPRIVWPTLSQQITANQFASK